MVQAYSESKLKMLALGERIAAARNAKNLTQREVGSHLGIGGNSVSMWERGLAPFPQKYAEKLEAFLGVDAGTFAEEESEGAISSADAEGFARSVEQQRSRAERSDPEPAAGEVVEEDERIRALEARIRGLAKRVSALERGRDSDGDTNPTVQLGARVQEALFRGAVRIGSWIGRRATGRRGRR